MKVFGAPISSNDAYNNYQKTVSKELIDKIKIEVSRLNNNCLWGIKSSKLNSWNSIEKGDLIFFYRKNHIISICEVNDKFQDVELSINLWGYFESSHHPSTTFSLIIMLEKPIYCNIPFKIINKILGYNENYNLRSFFQLKGLEEYLIENNNVVVSNFIKNNSI
jgi:hypothetical protein